MSGPTQKDWDEADEIEDDECAHGVGFDEFCALCEELCGEEYDED